MKKAHLAYPAIVLILIALFVAKASLNLSTTPPEVNQTPNPTDSAVKREQLEVGENSYSYSFFKVGGKSSIALKLNTSDQKTSQDIKSECKEFVNGGFYTQDDKPIGLFYTNGETLSDYQQNSTFNGILSLAGDNYSIQKSPQIQDGQIFALQSGPILMLDQNPLSLNLSTDKNSRRLVAAVDQEGSLMFAVFYDQNNSFLGPTLKELPDALEALSQKHSLGIVDAINLDGGKASFFRSDSLFLSEATLVGSYFCIN